MFLSLSVCLSATNGFFMRDRVWLKKQSIRFWWRSVSQSMSRISGSGSNVDPGIILKD